MPRKPKHNLIGMRFGKLVVVSLGERPENIKHKSNFYWNCVCDCGQTSIVSGGNLPKTKSCSKCYHNNKTIDLHGTKQGTLTVIKKDDSCNGARWICKCDCGETKSIRGASIASGQMTCGAPCHKAKMPFGVASKRQYYRNYIREAARANKEFELTEEQFYNIIFRNCYYCGTEPVHEPYYYSKNSGINKCNGIDRVDSNKGYVIDNCVPCCRQCNTAKLNHSAENFIDWVRRVYETMIERKKIAS